MEKLLEPAFNALARWPIVQGAFAVLIITIAYIMVMKGLREKPPPAAAAPTPVQIESPWLVIQLNTISVQIQEINRRIGHIHERIDHVGETVRDAMRHDTQGDD